MENTTKNIDNSNGGTIQTIYDDNRVVQVLVSNNQPLKNKYMVLLNDDGNVSGHLWDNNPNHPKSWIYVYNDEDEIVKFIKANDPTHPESWHIIFDDFGTPLHYQFGDGRIKSISKS